MDQELDNYPKDIFLHFDLNENKHDIPINQSILIEQSLNTIVQELNKVIFNNQLEIKVSVYPSEEGGHIKRFGIGITVGVSFILGNIAPDIINGLVMGLGDGRNTSEYTRDGVLRVKENFVPSIQNFLEKDNNSTVSSGLSCNLFYKGYLAKNKIYSSILDNHEILGLGFSEEHIFPVTRNEFTNRIIDLESNTTPLNSVERIHKLIVISSINTIEEKQLSRQVKDENTKERFSVYMKDSVFYKTFLENPTYLKTIVVRIRYSLKRDENGDIQIGEKDIITVYKYNDIERIPVPEIVGITSAPLVVDGDGKEIINENYIEYSLQNSLF